MKPSIPQGTRDFDAVTIRRRKFILDAVKNVFELYGFEPLETPSFENLETLTGKYGDEGDKLVFKILNNGLDNPEKKEEIQKSFEEILSGKNKKNITERALRYDLTIPFARYVAMNYGKLTMPFKRYQMQSVWRADRPQKGRYREFYQCDADVAGSNSLISDIEFAEIYHTVFRKLKIDVNIKINNRKILSALAEICGSKNMTAITILIDKLEKIGIEKVEEELKANGFNSAQISTIKNYLKISGTNSEKLKSVKQLLGDTENGKKGIEEIEFILDYMEEGKNNSNESVTIDFTLARGLNYYTGVIYEVTAKNVEMGSIGGGGRYDDLTGLFGLPGIPGVGISFGVDRIYDVMTELNLFPIDINKSTTALFLNLGEKEARFAFHQMQKLRSAGISCELFYEPSKLDKQFKYATKKNIQFAIIIGSKEIDEETCVVKNLATGEQKTIHLLKLTSYFN
ncbi:MAG TPA: histidine--tRNA ligase [Chitinophagaceae bacterium]|nr:histidine--tRNA ligase [Chitinophagaceae bacterium]